MANAQRKKRTFKEVEVVHVIDLGNGRKFRFAVVEIDGETCGDMRFWEKGRKEDVMLPLKRGIPFPEERSKSFPVNPEEFLAGFEKLRKKLQAA